MLALFELKTCKTALDISNLIFLCLCPVKQPLAGCQALGTFNRLFPCAKGTYIPWKFLSLSLRGHHPRALLAHTGCSKDNVEVIRNRPQSEDTPNTSNTLTDSSDPRGDLTEVSPLRT